MLASIVKLDPTLIPPRTVALAVGNEYAGGIVGLLSISAKPVVASQSDLTGAVLSIVILLLAESHATPVPLLPVNSMLSVAVSYTHLTLPTKA